MPHLADRILTPSEFSTEGVLFPLPLRAYPGKPIVQMLEIETKRGESFDFQGRTVQLEVPKELGEKFAPDFGLVYDPAGCLDLEKGQLVAVKPYTGVWLTNRDMPEIPEGRTVKILGSVDYWDANVLAVVEA